MSVHPSLKIDKAGAQQRSVLTRIERIKDLMKKGLWEQKRSPLGLPKLKIVRVKAQKKTKEAVAGDAAAPAAGAPAGAKAPAGKANEAAKK